MDEDARTSAIGLFNYAHSYAASAVALAKTPPNDTTHPEAPVDFLAFHAIELYLKAFLRAKGLTVAEVKKIGHGLTKLRDRARDLGLTVDDGNGVIVLAAASMMERRYISTGTKVCHPHELVFEVCRRLHYDVGEELRTLGLATRLPSIESLLSK